MKQIGENASAQQIYQEIKDYVWEHYQTKVSHLYIAQIKKKCGLNVGENFNKTKTEGNKVPNCPEEKERMIREALEIFWNDK